MSVCWPYCHQWSAEVVSSAIPWSELIFRIADLPRKNLPFFQRSDNFFCCCFSSEYWSINLRNPSHFVSTFLLCTACFLCTVSQINGSCSVLVAPISQAEPPKTRVRSHCWLCKSNDTWKWKTSICSWPEHYIPSNICICYLMISFLPCAPCSALLINLSKGPVLVGFIVTTVCHRNPCLLAPLSSSSVLKDSCTQPSLFADVLHSCLEE